MAYRQECLVHIDGEGRIAMHARVQITTSWEVSKVGKKEIAEEGDGELERAGYPCSYSQRGSIQGCALAIVASKNRPVVAARLYP